jgi:hypothetical protein
MSQPPDETPESDLGEEPAKEQKPETENAADKAIREAREKAEAEKVRGLSTTQVAAAVISTGLL